MKDWQSLSHVRWDCKYHVVFISKYRHRTIYGEVRREIGSIIRDLCQQKGIDLHEGHAMADHIHLLLSIPPKFSVANTVDTHGLTPVALAKEILICIEGCMPSNSLQGWHSPTLLRAWSSAMI